MGHKAVSPEAMLLPLRTYQSVPAGEHRKPDPTMDSRGSQMCGFTRGLPPPRSLGRGGGKLAHPLALRSVAHLTL